MANRFWRNHKTPALLAAAALALRLAVLLWRGEHDPLFHAPINDAAHYDAWARALAAGRGFGVADAPYYMPPLYPHLVAFLFRLGAGPWGPTLLQTACGVLTVTGVHALGRSLFGERAGLWAGGLALLFAPLLWFEGWLLPTALNMALLTAVLNLAPACRARREGRVWPRLLLLGLLLGVATINRPQHLLLLAGLAAWWGWGSWRRPAAVAKPVLLLALGAALAILPVTLRNVVHGGERVLVSTNGGVNFYLGNFDGASGRFEQPREFPPDIARQQEASMRLARRDAGRSLDWRGASSHWFGRGLRDLAADPGAALKLYARKLRLVFAWREMEHNFLAAWVHRHTGPGRWLIPSLGLLWLLAMPGLVAALRERRAETAPLLLLAGTTLLTCLLFWVNTRHRLPLLIPLAVFAGAGLAAPRLWLSRTALAAVAVTAVLVAWPTGDHEGASFFVDLGRVHAQRQEFVEARQAYQAALDYQPHYPQALNGIALTHMEQGDPETAIRLLRDLLRRYPDYAPARRNLERILALTGGDRPPSTER